MIAVELLLVDSCSVVIYFLNCNVTNMSRPINAHKQVTRDSFNSRPYPPPRYLARHRLCQRPFPQKRGEVVLCPAGRWRSLYC